MAEVICVKDFNDSQGLALVFVHGLSGDSHKTWMYDPTKASSFWPEWLANETQCAIWTVNYNAALSNWVDRAMPLPDQGTSFLDCLSHEPRLQNRRLVLIGHSMGGLVIKTAIVQANTQGVERHTCLINSIHGVIFIATPHNGSHLANLANAVSLILHTNEQVGDLLIHDPHLRQLNRQFLHLQQSMGFSVRTFAETKPVSICLGKDRWWNLFRFLRVQKMVVDPSSSEPHVPREVAIPLEEDHFSICKPRTNSHQLYKAMVSFVNEHRTKVGTKAIEEELFGSGGRTPHHEGKKCEEFWDAFADVRSYLDAGDYVSAIHCQLGDKEFLESDPETCIDVVSICQKFGRLDEAEKYIEQLLELDHKPQWQSHHEACLQAIRFKVLSQRHRHEEVIKEYNDLCERLRSVGRRDLISGVLRRAAVAFAVHHECVRAIRCLEQAEEVSTMANDAHDSATANVYSAMIRGLACPNSSTTACVEYLVTAQESYLTVPLTRNRFQAMPLKSTIQSLYAEAAVLLTLNRTQNAGLVRVAIAHLLGPQGHTNPDMEGYAELLALIENKSISAMFRQAMQSGDESRKQFQKSYPTCSRFIQQCKSVPEIVREQSPTSWRGLRTFIQNLDRTFEGTPQESR